MCYDTMQESHDTLRSLKVRGRKDPYVTVVPRDKSLAIRTVENDRLVSCSFRQLSERTRRDALALPFDISQQSMYENASADEIG